MGHFDSPNYLYILYMVWTVGRSWSAQREPTVTWGGLHTETP